MNVIFLIVAIFFGVIVLTMDMALSYGIALFWRDGARIVPVIYALTEIAVTAMYVDAIVRMWIE